MRTHTNEFKEELKVFGRQIQGKIVYYPSYELITEDSNNILTEADLQIISEQTNYEDATEIDAEDIFSISIIKNGDLLQSLMKEFDFESKIELNIGSVVNPQFGLLVNGDYEYLNYGNYVINSKEFNMDTETWSYVCYDKMLFSMVKYRGLNNIEYPITIKQYIKKLCDKVGLQFEDSTFVNQGQLIYEDLYKNRDVTYRDIFDEISKIVAGNLLINDGDKLKVGYPTQTNDTINEDYLKDTNVRMSEKVGVINSVAILDSDNDLQYVAEDTQSIKENEMTRVTITDNLIAMNGDTQEIADNILNKLNGLYYYANDLQTTGVCYYDFLDLFNVEARGNIYQCLLLNNEITITQGIEEHIFTENFEELETNANEYTTSVISNKQVQFKINQQEGKLESKVEKDGVISAINQSAEQIQINANKLSFEGATIDMTADNVKIKGENLSIDGDEISITDNGDTYDSNFKIEYEDNNSNYWIKNKIYSHQATFIGKDNYSSPGYLGKTTIGLSPGVSSFSPIISLEFSRTENDDYTKWIDEDEYLDYGLTSIGANRIYLYYNNKDTTITANGITTGNITCSGTITSSRGVCQGSREEIKKNFEKLTNAKEILKATDIYKYNLKNEKDNAKKSIGFVIGDKFNYSQEITSENNDGANIYSMVSVLWQVVKEQQEEIKELKEMIKYGKY